MEFEILDIPSRKIKQLRDAGIETVEDLYRFIPKKYYDYRKPKRISDLQDGNNCAVIGTVYDIQVSDTRRGSKMTTATLRDGKDYLKVFWFGRSYASYKAGDQIIVCGPVKEDMIYSSKAMYPICDSLNIPTCQRIFPIYKKVKGMSGTYFNEVIAKALKKIPDGDYLEDEIRTRYSLLKLSDAYYKIHCPSEMNDIDAAKNRFVFDDLFVFGFQLEKLENSKKSKTPFKFGDFKIWEELTAKLSFRMTADQHDRLCEIRKVLQSGNRLNALLQGDVGCGKTLVAEYLMAAAAKNGFQSCLLAPTEVLARQHYEGIREFMAPFGIHVGFLSGSMKTRDKKAVYAAIEKQSIDIVIGTHAVIQKNVHFAKLGLVVIDEQHRFGVTQRDRLAEIEPHPHLLTMSATPIPRTLSMALYGDAVQVYTIRTMPEGKLPIKTCQVFKSGIVNAFMLREIRKGRQCYVVCPLIEKSTSEKMADVQSAEEIYNALRRCFQKYPETKIGIITGDMSAEQIRDRVQAFEKNEINMLVSTTIIEVGVNVPNATVMVIKNSERFGLAQLHQLRGRVGRSCYQSYCILQPNKPDKKTDIICGSTDGFEIAKEDLMMRGPGNYIGTKQSGSNKYVMLMLANVELFMNIKKTIAKIYQDHIRFAKYANLNDINLNV